MCGTRWRSTGQGGARRADARTVSKVSGLSSGIERANTKAGRTRAVAGRFVQVRLHPKRPGVGDATPLFQLGRIHSPVHSPHDGQINHDGSEVVDSAFLSLS